jgi:predicted TIM-barrel fold metal-dependent hydrolase
VSPSTWIGLSCLVFSAVAARVFAQEALPTEGIIDVHAHIGRFRGYPMGLDFLVANVRRYKIRMALVSNINGAHLPGITGDLSEGDANEETARSLAMYPFLRGLAWAQPTAPGGSPRNVEPYLKDGRFVGRKVHPRFNQFRADDPRVDGYLDLCQTYNVPAVFHSGPENDCHPRTIYRLAKRHPRVAVVLYHMVFLSDTQPALDVAYEAKSKGDARIYLETSQTSAQAILDSVGRLGSPYVLFGSDATYFGQGHYGAYLETLRTLQQKLSPKDYANITFANAVRLFRLDH